MLAQGVADLPPPTYVVVSDPMWDCTGRTKENCNSFFKAKSDFASLLSPPCEGRHIKMDWRDLATPSKVGTQTSSVHPVFVCVHRVGRNDLPVVPPVEDGQVAECAWSTLYSLK